MLTMEKATLKEEDGGRTEEEQAREQWKNEKQNYEERQNDR